MTTDATAITLGGGQTVTVVGTAENVAAACRARTLSADDGFRQFRTVDGDTATVNIGAIALIRAADTKVTRTFGFGRELDG